MRRIVVVGCPGAGKSTLARELARQLGLTHIELDALFHQPGWTAAPTAEFQANLRVAMDDADRTTNGWAVCGNYNSHTDAIHVERADAVIWLDLPRATIMRRVVRRTVGRAVLRKELWNGNREPLTNLYRWNPQQNIMRWAWINHPKYQAQYAAKKADGSWDGLAVHHLRSPREVEHFLDAHAGVDRAA